MKSHTTQIEQFHASLIHAELILEYTPALKKTSATKNNGALSSLLMEETVPIHLLCIENPHRLCIDMTVDRVFQ